MLKRQLISLVVAAALCAGASAPLGARGVVIYNETAHVANAAADADAQANDVETADLSATGGGDADSKPATTKSKGNGFARALGAPFRALARLFGGGKKKTNDAAKRPPESKTNETASATTSAAPASQPASSSNNTTASQSVSASSVNAPEVASAPQVASATQTVAASQIAPASNVAPAQSSAPAAVGPRVSQPLAEAQHGVRIVRPSEGVATAEAARPRLWVPVIEGIPRDSLSQGRALLRHGYAAEAVAELTVASTIGPDLVEANNLLGLAHARLNQHKLAVEAYERALSVAPANAQVLNNLGYSLYHDNQTAAALKRLKQAARLAPGSPDVLSNMAVVQARLGKYGDAFKSFTRAYGEYQARIKVGELLEQAGRAGEAVKHYEAALKVEPNSKALLERLAELYDRAGRTRDAEAARRRAGEQPNKQKTATGGGG